jgi:transcriptional regulator NrdR family protein
MTTERRQQPDRRGDSGGSGLPCPQCGSYQVRVVDSRSSQNMVSASGGRYLTADPRIRRRRGCIECGHRFTTEERYRDVDAKEERSIVSRLREIATEIERATKVEDTADTT